MKKLILIFMLLMPVMAYATPCVDIEYGELADMSQGSFEKEYCKMKDELNKNIEYFNTESAEECKNISEKMERVYKNRFKKYIPKCSSDDSKK